MSGQAERGVSGVLFPCRAPRRPSHDEADKLLTYALTICQYGERAPGGDENWHDFAGMAEDYMRRRGCAERGHHTPNEPACPDCKASEPCSGYDSPVGFGEVPCRTCGCSYDEHTAVR